MSRKDFTLILKDSTLLAPNVRHFVFEREDGLPFDFIPGQFITLFIPTTTEKPLRRSYSLANVYSSRVSVIELAASYVSGGAASQYLFAMSPGDKIIATGPFGRLVLRDEQPERYILVATGTGITPYRSMLVEIEKRFKEQENLQVVLLFGVRKPEDLLYGEEFVNFSKENPRFAFHAYYSRWQSDQLASCEHVGYVSSAFSQIIAPNPAQDVFYLCGNPNMIDDVFTLLLGHGVATENIRREKYISS